MDKYCMYCGEELVEGRVCACQAKKQVETAPIEEATTLVPKTVAVTTQVPEKASVQPQVTQTQQQLNQAKETSVLYLKKLWNIFIELIKLPGAKCKEFIDKEDMSMSVGFIVLQGILSALVGVMNADKLQSSTNEIISGIFDGIIDMMEDLSPLLGLASFELGDTVKMPLGKIFIATTAASVLISLTMVILVWIAGKLLKQPCNFKQAVGITSFRSIILIPIIFTALVLGFFSPVWGLLFYFGASLYGLCFLGYVYTKYFDCDSWIAPVLFGVMIVVFSIISTIIVVRFSMFYIPEVKPNVVNYFQ